MPEITSLKAIADAIALNNHFDACIIICPEGEGGQMHIATATREPGAPPSPFQGTEVLWKDLARIVGAGADPVVMPRTEIAAIVKGSNDVNQALGDLLGVATAMVKAVRLCQLYDHFPGKEKSFKVNEVIAASERLEEVVRKGFPR